MTLTGLLSATSKYDEDGRKKRKAKRIIRQIISIIPSKVWINI